MIKRLKNLWALSNANQDVVDRAVEAIRENQELANHPIFVVAKDDEAEFFSEGTLEDYKRQQEEDQGFVKRVFGL